LTAAVRSAFVLNPAGTVVQYEAPGPEYFPTPQLLHFKPSPDLPGWHNAQDVSDVAVQLTEISSPELQVEQTVHAGCPADA
jgi:hypothetical protein